MTLNINQLIEALNKHNVYSQKNSNVYGEVEVLLNKQNLISALSFNSTEDEHTISINSKMLFNATLPKTQNVYLKQLTQYLSENFLTSQAICQEELIEILESLNFTLIKFTKSSQQVVEDVVNNMENLVFMD